MQRSLCWVSIVCGCLLNSQLGATSRPDIPGADKMGLSERASRLARGLHLSAAQWRHC